MTEAPTLEEVWSLYGDRLRHYLQSRVSNSADVDDVLQLVLYKTHEQLPALRNLAHIRAWLFRVAKNALIDNERRVNRRRESFEQAPPTSVAAEFEDMLQSDQVDLSNCVRAFVNRLSAKDRVVLEAVDLEGLTQRAFADKHGMSYSTLKSRVQRARDRLAAELSRCCSVEITSSGEILGTPRDCNIDCAPAQQRSKKNT